MEEKTKFERVSLHIPEDLYWKYLKEVQRRKVDERQKSASMNKLVQEAMEAYLKRLPGAGK